MAGAAACPNTRRSNSPPASPAACSPSGRLWAHPSRWSAAAIPPCAATSSPRCRPSTPLAAGSPAPDSTGCCWLPAYFEAGRFTAGDIHWANVAGEPVPVGDSEFAKDATFGYTSSNLREFVAEKSGGTITADQVHSISLTDIREGGPDRVADILDGVTGGAFVVVNATDYADLEIVVLGGLQALERGKSFVYRCGPSFPRALAGLEPQGPLTAAQIWRTGRPNRRPPARRFGGRLDVVDLFAGRR